jgi:hypothetical protein
MANWAAWRAAPRPISSPCTPPLYVDQSYEIKPRYMSIGSAAFVAIQNTVHLPPCAGASELSVPVRLLCSGWSNKACVSSLDSALGYW